MAVMERWKRCNKVEATIVTGGGFFALKGLMQDPDPRRMTVWLHEEHSSVSPYGAPDQRTMFTPDGSPSRSSMARWSPSARARDSFAGHQMNTPWDPLHRAYFNGEALWTYLTTPFLLAMDGVRVEETEPWREGAEPGGCCALYFPGPMENPQHGPGFLLWRRYDAAPSRLQREHRGRFPAAQLTSTYIEADGIRLRAHDVPTRAVPIAGPLRTC